MTGPHRAARLWAGPFLCALLAVLAGCAQLVPQTVALRSGWPAGVPERVEWTGVPFFPQVDYQCGPAALATVLGYSGVKVTPEQLSGLSGQVARSLFRAATVPGVLFQLRRDADGGIGINYLSHGSEEMSGIPREELYRDFGAFLKVVAADGSGQPRVFVPNAFITIGSSHTCGS